MKKLNQLLFYKRIGFDKLMKKKMNDLFHVLSIECNSHSLDQVTISLLKKKQKYVKLVNHGTIKLK